MLGVFLAVAATFSTVSCLIFASMALSNPYNDLENAYASLLAFFSGVLAASGWIGFWWWWRKTDLD